MIITLQEKSVLRLIIKINHIHRHHHSAADVTHVSHQTFVEAKHKHQADRIVGGDGAVGDFPDHSFIFTAQNLLSKIFFILFNYHITVLNYTTLYHIYHYHIAVMT